MFLFCMSMFQTWHCLLLRSEILTILSAMHWSNLNWKRIWGHGSTHCRVIMLPECRRFCGFMAFFIFTQRLDMFFSPSIIWATVTRCNSVIFYMKFLQDMFNGLMGNRDLWLQNKTKKGRQAISIYFFKRGGVAELWSL